MYAIVTAPAAERHYWIDNLSPWAIHITGDLGIRWYGLAYISGFLAAYLIFLRWAKQKRLPISFENVSGLISFAAIGVIVGGRLGYCILYELPEIVHNPAELIAVWHGGMASHGGILGLILAVWIFARRRGLAPWIFLDAVAATGPIGIFFGRIANFINGELWGRPATVPWAVIFPEAPLVNGVNLPRHPSQLYAACIEGLLVFVVAQVTFYRQKRAGMTTAAVCIAYGIGRFLDEFWREPDLGQPVFWGWMSKGQLYTIPMLLAGIALLLWRRRSVRTEEYQEAGR